MSSQWNAVDAQWEVLGDGTGCSRYRKQLTPPPVGTTQATYIMRLWAAEMTASLGTTSSVLWSPEMYFGFKFDSNFLGETDPANTEFDNFLGVACYGGNSPYNHWDAVYSLNGSYPDDVSVSLGGNLANYARGYLLDGTGENLADISMGGANIAPLGYNLISSQAGKVGGFVLPANAAKGAMMTLVWQVRSSFLDESVQFRAWRNSQSVNLGSVNISTLSGDNIEATFPVSSYRGTTSLFEAIINGAAETGTVWRPSSGVMAFPTHFMCAWPDYEYGIVIKHLGVHYSRSTYS